MSWEYLRLLMNKRDMEIEKKAFIFLLNVPWKLKHLLVTCRSWCKYWRDVCYTLLWFVSCEVVTFLLYVFFSSIAGNHCHLLVKMFKLLVSNCPCLQGQVFGCLWLVSLVKITKIDFDVNLSLNICGFYKIPLKNLQNYFIILGMMFPPYWFVGMELCVIMSSVSRFVNPKF